MTVDATTTNALTVAVLTVAALSFPSESAGQTTYAVFDLGSLGGTTTTAAAINNAGQIVGKSGSPSVPAGNAYIYQNGTMTYLSPRRHLSQ